MLTSMKMMMNKTTSLQLLNALGKSRGFFLECGACALYPKSFFPWQGLPYPKEHAELGSLFMQSEDEAMHKRARQMASFQEATLDHQKRPFSSLLQQEGSSSFEELKAANVTFFEAVGITPSDHLQFSESTLCMVSRRSNDASLYCLGSGCKSGIGAFLFHDAGIINFGPQLLPIGNCSGFGLAGRAQKSHLKSDPDEFFLSFLCRLAAPSSRKVNALEDSGYSGLWTETKVRGNLKQMSLQSHFEGVRPINQIVYSFFGKGEACVIAGSHKLHTRSLDRYCGPPQRVNFIGKRGGIAIAALEGLASMEVIPLASDESFWGADFLAAYTLGLPTVSFSLSRQDLVF
jgi:hypothetical protein